VSTLGGRIHAAIGPAIGPCCYEVGPEVAEPFTAAFGQDVLQGRNLDLWTSAERALLAAGVEEVERVDLCTSCNPGAVLLAPPHREAARRPGSDRTCRLRPFALHTSASAPRSEAA
jgi:copper oxidase (laccase) domain-containing protein